MTHVITQHGISTTFVGNYGRMYGDCFARNVFYEQTFLDYVRSLGRAGTYLDIGTNVGNHALFFAQLCRAERVYAFEPLPHYAKRIADNIAANPASRPITLMRFGLGDLAQTRSIVFNGIAYDIDVRRLDDLAVDIAGEVSVVKIDVEGMEENVIRGGMARIARDRPLVFAEANTPGHFEGLSALFSQMGYRATGRRWNASPTYEFEPR